MTALPFCGSCGAHPRSQGDMAQTDPYCASCGIDLTTMGFAAGRPPLPAPVPGLKGFAEAKTITATPIAGGLQIATDLTDIGENLLYYRSADDSEWVFGGDVMLSSPHDVTPAGISTGDRLDICWIWTGAIDSVAGWGWSNIVTGVAL